MNEFAKLISQAIEKGANEHVLCLLEKMSNDYEKMSAKRNFFTDLAAFQTACPEIPKDKTVMSKDGKNIRYRYASLEDIIKQTKNLLGQYGFSYQFKTSFDKDSVIVTCILAHKNGHQEEASFRAVIEKEAFMGEIQKMGAAMSYAKRYSFLAVTGIMTADEDTDAKEPESEETKIDEMAMATEAQLKMISALLHQLNIDDREKRLMKISNILGRAIHSSKELTKKEASQIIEELKNETKKE